MRRGLAPALLCSGLLGCASAPLQPERDTAYQVEWIGERPLIDNSHLSINLGADGRAYGNAGCNHWFAGYRLEGETLIFDKPGSTRKLCPPALMEQEARFLALLESVQRWDISPLGQLRFWPASGKPLRLLPEEG